MRNLIYRLDSKWQGQGKELRTSEISLSFDSRLEQNPTDGHSLNKLFKATSLEGRARATFPGDSISYSPWWEKTIADQRKGLVHVQPGEPAGLLALQGPKVTSPENSHSCIGEHSWKLHYRSPLHKLHAAIQRSLLSHSRSFLRYLCKGLWEHFEFPEPLASLHEGRVQLTRKSYNKGFKPRSTQRM